MLTALSDFANLQASELLFVIGAVFLAGLVRGFAGFALSAVVMASAVVVIAPVELIPICYFLEGAASLAMLRGGMKDADMSIVWVLAIGSAVGTPIGLWATTSIDADLSKLVALYLVLGLTAAQLFRLTPPGLNSRPGLYATGIGAGIVTGLASIGGMVVALYVLARNAEARTMRASLVMFLFIGMFTSLIYYYIYGIMDAQAVKRSIILVPVVLAGVVIGSLFFRPSLAPYYKRFCLSLLIALCLIGLARQTGII